MTGVPPPPETVMLAIMQSAHMATHGNQRAFLRALAEEAIAAAPIQQIDSVAVRARLQAQGIVWNPQRLGGFHKNLHTWASNNHTPVPWLHDFGVNSVPALYTMAPSVARVVLEI